MSMFDLSLLPPSTGGFGDWAMVGLHDQSLDLPDWNSPTSVATEPAMGASISPLWGAQPTSPLSSHSDSDAVPTSPPAPLATSPLGTFPKPVASVPASAAATTSTSLTHARSETEDLPKRSSKRQKKSTAQPKKKKTRRRRRKPVNEETLRLRRQRHNEVEIRRRKKIADNFAILRELTGCEQSNQGSILQSAISMIRELSAQADSVSTTSSRSESPKEHKRNSPVPRPSRSPFWEHSPVSMFALSVDGKLVDVNPAFTALAGITALDLQQDTAPSFFNLTSDTNSLSASFDAISELLSGKAQSVDCFRQLNSASGKAVSTRVTLWLQKENEVDYIQGVMVPLNKSHTAHST